MVKKSNWKTKAIVLASLISIIVLPFYPSLSSAQEAAPDKAVPKKVDPAPATGVAGAAGGVAGTGQAASILPAVIYGIAAAGVVVGSIVANSVNGDGTAKHGK